MEKRFYLGVGILVVFLLLGLFVAWGMEQISGRAATLLAQAEEAILSGSVQTAEALAGQAKRIWEKGWCTIALAADHGPMDEIDGLFAQMDFFVKNGNRAELGACCARLAELVEAVSDAHALTWWNIL